MATTLDAVLGDIDAGQQAAIDGLKQYLRIPSISAQPDYAIHVRRCAQWIAEQLKLVGLEAQMEPTPGHPVVVARTPRKAHRPTVLLYGHYDVQPPEPLEQWRTPPFEPSVRDGAIYARGACDDKGQVWAHVQALGAWHRHGGLPVNLVVVLEGEEEVGSSHLEQFLRDHRDQLQADVAVISDTDQYARGMPAITYGLRGLVYSEVILTGPSHDLHSGLYGGVAPNPANILCQLLASLHDDQGRVTVEGFYEDVTPLTAHERDAWAKLPADEAGLAREFGVASLAGEAGYSALERRWARPTLDVNGLTSGYQGPGAKTIIPSRASAKVSMRLVPQQDPLKVQAAFEKTLRQRCPGNVRIEFAHHGASAAVLVPMEGKAMELAARAVERGFGLAPVLMREGGSIPVVGSFKNILGVDTLLVGFGLPDDRVHSPNEKFDLDALHKGARTAAALYEELAKL